MVESRPSASSNSALPVDQLEIQCYDPYPMKYAVWNNKGGVGKTFLSFVLGTELAHSRTDRSVLLVDMCPQANLSEIVLGGNGQGAKRLQRLLKGKERRTIGGYFDARITSPHKITGDESRYLLRAKDHNSHLSKNVWVIAGDPSLEIQAQVISQIGGQTLPAEAWKNVHNWLADLITACTATIGGEVNVFVDCNPSFSAYTELSMAASERLIIPCSSDGSSARAIDNVGALLYGIGESTYGDVNFKAKAEKFNLTLPLVHSVLLNRSTLYNKKASKAFGAMFEEIKGRTRSLKKVDRSRFVEGKINFKVVPDNHSVAIVCSHLGKPLYSIHPGKYKVHDTHPQVNSEPLNRYKEAVASLLQDIP
jgi:cellulose biosynthesis protein BcsQ